ncbi:VHL beta domain-containing protein [Vacuolonema iberomarrocanum]|uniref:VHL beta domain-containing protein n=1 Tax=Vacuolonema iberomarrocanum TaxID=3454632 RepID=UPI0019EAAA6F|nr:hypothetical protein [filamentous cyanobacterium LEGE 07170]
MTKIPADQIESVLQIAAQLSVEREQAATAIPSDELIAAAAEAQIPAECVEQAIAQVVPAPTEPPSQSVSDLASAHPAEGKAVSRSLHAKYRTAITFVNRANDVRKIYWLDYSGQRQLYKQLAPRQRYQLQTFLTHPWLITDEQDQGLDIYYPDSTERLIELH